MDLLSLDFFIILFKYYFLIILMILIIHDLLVFVFKDKKYIYMLPSIPFGLLHSFQAKNLFLKIMSSVFWLLIIVPYSAISDCLLMFDIKIGLIQKLFSFKKSDGIKELKKLNQQIKEHFKDKKW